MSKIETSPKATTASLESHDCCGGTAEPAAEEKRCCCGEGCCSCEECCCGGGTGENESVRDDETRHTSDCLHANW